MASVTSTAFRHVVSVAAVAWLAVLPGCEGDGRRSHVQALRAASIESVVRRGTLVRRHLLTGELVAVRADNITVPRTPNWQIQIRWLEADGTEVKPGQKVVEFDNSSFAATLADRRLAADRSEKALQQQQASSLLALADKVFLVEKRRIEMEKARLTADVPADLSSRRDWEEKQLAFKRACVAHDKALEELDAARVAADADIAVSLIQLEKDRRELAVAESAITSLTATAPRAGVLQIAEHPWEGRRFQIGDTAWVGLTVARIPDLSQLEVEVPLFDVDDGVVAVGMPAECALDTAPDSVFTGRVAAVSAVAQEPARASQRRAFTVRVALDRTDPALMRPGMSVSVAVETGRRDGVLLVPRAGLAETEVGTEAVLAGGRRVAVTLGECSAAECVVLSGLDESARVAAAVGVGR